MAEHTHPPVRLEATSPSDDVRQRADVDGERGEHERARWVARMSHPATALIG